MAVTINTVGILHNQHSSAITDDPMECDDFTFAIDYTTDAKHCFFTKWTIDGDIPNGIIISQSGVIQGKIAGFWDQPLVKHKPFKYPEYDARNYPEFNGRPINDYHDFEFDVICEWVEKDPNGACIIPGETTSTVKIRVIKDFDADAILFAKVYLDGVSGHEPYFCNYNGVDKLSRCEAIGGEWNKKLQICSISTPQDKKSCEAVDGVWENGYCNMTLASESYCQLVGGEWTKNYLEYNGTKYYDSAAYFEATGYADKLPKLTGIFLDLL